jgi:hypothetical protein
MRRSVALFPIVLALGAIILAPVPGAKAQSAQEGPREIEKCQTIDKPGSYKLVNNLTATTGTCLTITADFVTIDLAGFSITGKSGISRTAIAAVPPSGGRLLGIAVRNGSISGFFTGVTLGSLSSSLSIVEGLRVFGLVEAGDVGISAGGIVRGNTVGGFGAAPPHGGVGIVASGIVTGNQAVGNGSGMVIGQGSTVIGNSALGNAISGIVVDCASNVTDNTAANNLQGPNLVLNGDGCNNTNNVAP